MQQLYELIFDHLLFHIFANFLELFLNRLKIVLKIDFYVYKARGISKRSLVALQTAVPG
jgi:hypothetical protein